MLAKSTDTISSIEFGKWLKSVSQEFEVQAGCSNATHWQFFSRFIKKNASTVLTVTNQAVSLVKQQSKPGTKPFSVSYLNEAQVLGYIGLHRNLKKVKDFVMLEFQKQHKVPLKDKMKVTLGKLGVVIESDLEDLREEGALLKFDESALSEDEIYDAYARIRDKPDLKVPLAKSAECYEMDYGALLLGVLTEDVTLKKANKVLPKGLVLEISQVFSSKCNGEWGVFIARCFARIPHKSFVEFWIPLSSFSFVNNKDLVEKINKISLPAPKGILQNPIKDMTVKYYMD